MTKRRHVFLEGERLPKGEFVTVDVKTDPLFRRRMMWLVVYNRNHVRRYRTCMYRIFQCMGAAKKRYPRCDIKKNMKMMKSTVRRQPWGRKVMEFFPIDEHGRDAVDRSN
jgi:hypothetical protein